MNLYKSFDSVELFLENIWRLFPNIISGKNSGNIIIHNLLIDSKNFCNFKKSKKYKIQTINEGGFGIVGNLKSNNKQIKTLVFSFNEKSSGVFECNIISKQNKNKIDFTNAIYVVSKNTVSLIDPLSEMVFGSILSHLYDLNICPFIVKYFGNYLCEDNESTIILEKSDYELLSMISRKNLTNDELQNILFQYIYCLYITKMYYGAVFFDTHLRNMLLTDLTQNTEYMYQGKYMKNIDYIFFEKKVNEYIVLKKTNYLLKLIDYGSMLLCFDRSNIDRFKKNIRLETNTDNIRYIGADQALKFSHLYQSYANTVDLLFTLLNIFEYEKFYSETIDKISIGVLGKSIKDFSNESTKIKTDDVFMRNHNVGIIDNRRYLNPEFLLTGLVKICNKSIKIKNSTVYYFEDDLLPENINENNSIILSGDVSNYIKTLNRFEKLLFYKNLCKNSVYKNITCEIYNNNKLNSREIFSTDFNLYTDNKYFSIKSFDLNKPETPIYKKYNTTLGFNKINLKKVNTFMDYVKYHIVRIKNYRNASIQENNFLVATNGISFPVGNNIGEFPLGFYANDETKIISQVDYPPFYDKYLAVIFCRDNKLFIEKYTIFKYSHDVDLNPVKVSENNFVCSSSIKTDPIILTTGKPYKFARTIGPIFVWDFNLIFDESLLDEKSNNIILDGNDSEYLFMGNSPGKFNMTDSTEIQTQLILIENEKSDLFLIFVEGNGFQAEGLDRINTAKLCKSLGAKKAVGISSGLSSNVLFKTGKNSNEYLSSVPINCKYPTILNLDF